MARITYELRRAEGAQNAIPFRTYTGTSRDAVVGMVGRDLKSIGAPIGSEWTLRNRLGGLAARYRVQEDGNGKEIDP